MPVDVADINDICFIDDIDLCCDGICSYSGGKRRLFHYIASAIYGLHARCFIDVCAGSGVVSLNIETRKKIVNEKDVGLAVIFKVLSIPEIEDKLITLMKKTKYTAELFEKAHKYWDEHSEYNLNDFADSDLAEAAYYSWVLRKMSRIGSQIDKKCNLNENSKEKLNNFKDKLYKYCGRLRGAEVTSLDLLEMLENYANNPQTIPQDAVFYIDPPYLPSKLRNGNNKNVYKNTFGAEQHKQMLEIVSRLPRERCSVIISGYDYANDVYRDALGKMENWRQIYVCDLAVMFGNGKNLKNGKRDIEKEYFYTNAQFSRDS